MAHLYKFLSKLTVSILVLILIVPLVRVPSSIDPRVELTPERPTPGLPPRPTPGLPSRPTSELPELPSDETGQSGAIIELYIHSQESDLWAVVQWQAANGEWHDVEGWRNQIVPNQVTRWWVAPKDLNTGPFRWIIYSESTVQKLVWESEPFNLPKSRETLRITALISN